MVKKLGNKVHRDRHHIKLIEISFLVLYAF